MRRHLAGTPVSWLKFWVFMCKEGGEIGDEEWKVVDGEPKFNDKLTDEYKKEREDLTELSKK